MPLIKSAIKRAKQSLVRRSRNLQVKRAVKQDIQAFHTATTEGDAAAIQTTMNAAYSEIDRAVKKHTLHKNTAARRKHQLAVAAQAATSEDKPSKPVKKTATKTAAVKKPTKRTAAK